MENLYYAFFYFGYVGMLIGFRESVCKIIGEIIYGKTWFKNNSKVSKVCWLIVACICTVLFFIAVINDMFDYRNISFLIAGGIVVVFLLKLDFDTKILEWIEKGLFGVLIVSFILNICFFAEQQ